VQSAAFDGGATVELRHHLGTPEYRDAGVHIPESFAIAVTHFDPVPVRELIAIASDIQDLISIATGRPAAFDSLSLRHPDVSRPAPAVPDIPEDVAESRYPLPIDLFARWTVTTAPQAQPLGVGDLYFTLDRVSFGVVEVQGHSLSGCGRCGEVLPGCVVAPRAAVVAGASGKASGRRTAANR
jgi:hypothetical protein